MNRCGAEESECVSPSEVRARVRVGVRARVRIRVRVRVRVEDRVRVSSTCPGRAAWWWQAAGIKGVDSPLLGSTTVAEVGGRA